MCSKPIDRVICAAFCAAIIGFALPGAAEMAPGVSIPAGNEDLEADDPLDELFDDAFEEELAGSSNMERHDPFERANRKTFEFNEAVIEYVIDPVTTGYRFVVPGPARRGLRRMFLNLDAPRILVNDLIQLRFRDAGETAGRFVLNTAFGFGGIFDVGSAAGWERHEADFGQSLGKMGVPSGPYLIVPVFGPTTVRDGFGTLIDLALQPLAYILGPAEIMLQVYIQGGDSLTFLDANRDKLQALEDSSIDFYAAMRSAYLQSRFAAIEEARGERRTAEETDPLLAEPPSESTGAQRRADATLR